MLSFVFVVLVSFLLLERAYLPPEMYRNSALPPLLPFLVPLDQEPVILLPSCHEQPKP